MKKFLLYSSLSLLSLPLMAESYTFDKAPTGPVDNVSQAFKAIEGTVNLRTFKNNKLIHLTGGKSSFTLTLDKVKKLGILNFKLERWTARKPFEFKVEALINGQWVEYYKIGKSVPTGMRQHTVALKGAFTNTLRFSNIAPENAGAMIDNIEIEEAVPMVFKGFNQAHAYKTPLLKGGKASKSFIVGISASGSESNITVNSLEIDVPDSRSIQEIQILAGGEQLFKGALHNGSNSIQIGKKLPPNSKDIRVYTIPSKSSIVGSSISLQLKSLSIDDKTQTFKDLKNTQRIAAHIVWPNYTMDDGTFVKGFRIPAMVTSKKGTLIAAYDIRYKHHGDLPADIDVGVSRSTDGGNTWSTCQNAIDLGGHAYKDGVGDPALLVDDATGRLWCAYLWGSGGNSLRTSKPGMKVGESGQFMLSYSDDDGLTWSEPRNITQEVAPGKDWRMVFNGPGNGITMRDGTLVFPSQYWDASGKSVGTPHASIIYSKDKGKTWHSGTSSKAFTSEAQVVELNDGSLMLNARYEFGRNKKRNKAHDRARSITITKDLGKTWTDHETSCTGSKALPEPICQASILRVASIKDGDQENILAFFNPDTKGGRHNMTLKLSYDEGQTWTHKLLVNPRGCYGYSSISMVDKKTIGILYETAGGLIFEKINIKDVPKI